MSIRAVELPPEDALRTCRFYVTNEHGYRLCGQLVEAAVNTAASTKLNRTRPAQTKFQRLVITPETDARRPADRHERIADSLARIRTTTCRPSSPGLRSGARGDPLEYLGVENARGHSARREAAIARRNRCLRDAAREWNGLSLPETANRLAHALAAISRHRMAARAAPRRQSAPDRNPSGACSGRHCARSIARSASGRPGGSSPAPNAIRCPAIWVSVTSSGDCFEVGAPRERQASAGPPVGIAVLGVQAATPSGPRGPRFQVGRIS